MSRWIDMLLYTVMSLMSLTVSAVADDLEPASVHLQPAFRIESAGQVINTGEFGGHSAPAVVDIDGDGLKDLVVGDFSGRFQFYRNEGDTKTAEYTHVGALQAGGADIKVMIYCCIGAQPRFADINGDQLLDLITNSYDPGHCHIFLRNRDGSFADGIEVCGQDGVPVRSSPDQKEAYESFGSFFETVDWDHDGDLDLLIGSFDGTLKLRMNNGNAKEWKFSNVNQSVETVQGVLNVKAHCCPLVADWDSDGLWDIITGSDDGSVRWFRNIGAKGKPLFADGMVMVEPCPDNGYSRVVLEAADVRRGIRSQIEVADMNGDGRLDLLVGDFFSAYDLRTNLSDEEKGQARKLIGDFQIKRDAFYEKVTLIEKELQARYPGNEVNSREAKAEFSKAYGAYMDGPAGIQFQADEKAFYDSYRQFAAGDTSEPIDEQSAEKSQGHVWVYLRK